MTGMAAGMAGVARAGAGAVGQRILTTMRFAREGVGQDFQSGSQSAWRATGGSNSTWSLSPTSGTSSAAPDWARTLRNEQRSRAHRQTAAQSIREGDKPVGGASPDLSERESA